MITIRAMFPVALSAMLSTAMAVPLQAQSAEISDADHKACVDAKDYQGCISARNGGQISIDPKSSEAPETYGHGPRVSVLPPPHPWIFGIGQI